MEENFAEGVYQREVLEFVTVATEFCSFVEQTAEFERKDYLDKLHKVLPFLYFKATLLPNFENVFDDGNEKFVTEMDWEHVRQMVASKTISKDDYLEVFDPGMQFMEEPVTSSISENIADIYQDIKDFVSLYQVGTEDIMNDAVWECKMNFEKYWGQKMVNVMRALHEVLYSDKDSLDIDEEFNEKNPEDRDTSNWLISKKMDQFREDDDE